MKEAVLAQMAVFDQEIKEHQRGHMTIVQSLPRQTFLTYWRVYEEADSDDEEPLVLQSEDEDTQIVVQGVWATISDFDLDDV